MVKDNKVATEHVLEKETPVDSPKQKGSLSLPNEAGLNTIIAVVTGGIDSTCMLLKLKAGGRPKENIIPVVFEASDGSNADQIKTVKDICFKLGLKPQTWPSEGKVFSLVEKKYDEDNDLDYWEPIAPFRDLINFALDHKLGQIAIGLNNNDQNVEELNAWPFKAIKTRMTDDRRHPNLTKAEATYLNTFDITFPIISLTKDAILNLMVIQKKMKYDSFYRTKGGKAEIEKQQNSLHTIADIIVKKVAKDETIKKALELGDPETAKKVMKELEDKGDVS